MEGAVLLERIEALDVAVAQTADVLAATGWIQQLRGFLDAKEGEITRRAQELHDSGAGLPPEDLLTRKRRSSRREAEKAKRRAGVLGQSPALNEQLAAGQIGAEHADALANVAGRLDDARRDELLGYDEELASAARSRTPEQFRRFLGNKADQLAADDGIERSERQRDAAAVSIGIDEQSGMGFIRGDLHPDDCQSIRRAVDAEATALRALPHYEHMRRDQLNAIALKNLTTGARATQRRNKPEVMVLVDLETMSDGVHEHGVCEYSDGTPATVETIRRHACDAGIIPVVLNGDGMPLDVGRAERFATPAQRAALRAIYRTCGVGGCERSFDDCDIHHLIEWVMLRGDTDLDNLLPLCSYHHHRAHEGRWRLELEPVTRELTVWLPNGDLHSRSRPDLVADRTAGLAA